MRLQINRRLKIGIILVITILIASSSILIYREYKVPQLKEEIVSLYKYNNKANIDYEVFLKPNILYNEASLGEGKLYITQFIEHIKTSYQYEFQGERKADINGGYEIIAQVEGYTGEGETYKTIWKKDFIILPKKQFESKDKSISVKEDVSINLNQYNDFARQVIEDSKVSTSVKLKVFMNTNVKASTDKGNIEDNITPLITIPLNTSYFEISGELSTEKPGAIEETRQVPLPVDKKKVMIYSVVLGILAIILLFILFFTKGVAIKDPKQKKLKKIFKSHGTRLVALNNELTITSLKQNAVKSIDDLVKISDEIAKPIMYKYSLDYQYINKFYVTDENEIYIYDINNDIDKSNQEKEENEMSNKTEKLMKKIANLKSRSSETKEVKEKESDSEA